MKLDDYLDKQQPEVKTTLKLAVQLIDEYSGSRARGDVRVWVPGARGAGVKVVKNLAGYYLLDNLPGDELTIRVEAEHYMPEERTVKQSELDPRLPVVEILLKPRPRYPFPSGATLIRGMVKIEKGEELEAQAGARVSVDGTDIENTTTTKGEFVCGFGTFSDEQIEVVDGIKYYKTADGTNVTLRVGYGTMTGSAVIEGVQEGKTTVLQAPVILKE